MKQAMNEKKFKGVHQRAAKLASTHSMVLRALYQRTEAGASPKEIIPEISREYRVPQIRVKHILNTALKYGFQHLSKKYQNLISYE